MNESSRIVVVKFGGSVLDSGSSVDKAAKVVKDSHERGDGVIVVVSAMKGVTDSLLEFSKHSNPSMPPSKLDDLLSLG
ncbi:MAG: aspartate kinase, partial [Thaumarchaeota archaeon]